MACYEISVEKAGFGKILFITNLYKPPDPSRT